MDHILIETETNMVDKRKDKKEKSIKEQLDELAGIDAEGKPLKYPDEDSILNKIVDLEETADILKEVLRTSSFEEWWNKNTVEGIRVYHDSREVIIPLNVELKLNYLQMKRIGIFAEEFGYTVATEQERL